MAGLIQNAQASQQPAPKADPAAVDRIVIAAKQVLAQVGPQLLQMMKSAGDPVRGVAQALIFVLMQLYEKSKGSLPPDAIVPAAQQIVDDIAKIGEAGGLFKSSPDLLKRSMAVAAQLFMRQNKMDPKAIMAQAKGGAPAPAAPPSAPPAAPVPAGV